MSFKNHFIKNALRSNKKVSVTISGNCMDPLFRHGDFVQVQKANQYNVGDVVLYEDWKGKFICHRINFIDTGIVFTSGDNNDLFDPPIKYNDLLGKLWVSSKGYENVVPIISMNYETYISSSIEEKHSKVAIIDTLLEEDIDYPSMAYAGSLPTKKDPLVLIRGLFLKDLEQKNIKIDGHLIV